MVAAGDLQRALPVQLPQPGHPARVPQGRLHPGKHPGPLRRVLVKEEVLGTGLAVDVRPLGPGLLDEGCGLRRAHVADRGSAAGFQGCGNDPLHRLRLRLHRAGAAECLQAVLPALHAQAGLLRHILVQLAVNRQHQAGFGHLLHHLGENFLRLAAQAEKLLFPAGYGGHEEGFVPHRPRLGQQGDLLQVVRPRPAVEGVIHIGPGLDLLLPVDEIAGAGGRGQGDGHFHHGGHAPRGGGHGARGEVLPVLQVSAADVDVAVDHTGEDQHVSGIHRLPGGAGGFALPEDADDCSVLHLHAAGKAALRPHHRAVEYVEIVHGPPLSSGRRECPPQPSCRRPPPGPP